MTAAETDLREAMRYRVCHEGVTRQGEFQPCDKTAVALRLDPTEGNPYPVCAYHSRADMVPLSDVKREAAEKAWDEGHRLTAPHSDRCEPTCPNPYRAAALRAGETS